MVYEFEMVRIMYLYDTSYLRIIWLFNFKEDYALMLKERITGYLDCISGFKQTLQLSRFVQ